MYGCVLKETAFKPLLEHMEGNISSGRFRGAKGLYSPFLPLKKSHEMQGTEYTAIKNIKMPFARLQYKTTTPTTPPVPFDEPFLKTYILFTLNQLLKPSGVIFILKTLNTLSFWRAASPDPLLQRFTTMFSLPLQKILDPSLITVCEGKIWTKINRE